MQVSPSQLVPGCIVVEAVYGKTYHPILPKNTIVTEKHITFLTKFLISKIHVSSRLADGTPFTPKEIEETSFEYEGVEEKPAASFQEAYHKTVAAFKELFISWQGNSTLDISVVRKMIFPLIDRIDQAEDELYYLHQYTSKEEYFYHHSVATALLSAYIAKKNNLADYRQVGLAGLLADCGMAKIDYDLVKKTGPLTSSEYKEIKKHPTYSYRMVENISSLPLKVKLGILQHHEKLDGSGYPLGVRKEKVHSIASCIAVADMYHAMISERYYQSGQSPFKVIEEILNSYFGKYDHVIIQNFANSLVNFSLGTKVKLSNGEEGEIIFKDENALLRPVIRLARTNEIVSLNDNRNLYIESVLSF